MAVLQLALDFTEIKRALAVAREAERYVDWLEVGTPLIKSEGLNAVRELRKKFPRKKIVADMKIMDTGAVEVEMAAKAGADIVTVMGAADLSTIREAIEAGKRYGVRIVVDLMNIEEGRISAIERLGPAYLCPHIGIDQQMEGRQAAEFFGRFRSHIPLIAAGGITSETAGEFVKKGAQVVVVGGAITKAKDAGKAARAIKMAMEKGKVIGGEGFRKFGENELVRAFSEVSTPNLSDAMQRSGELLGIKAIVFGVKMVGRAKTVVTFPGDWAKPVEAIDSAKKGEVIVIDAGGVDRAVWGELATESAKGKGIAGVVINGAIRDVDEVRKMKFPAFAKFINPTAGDPKGFGEIGCELEIEGVKVKPGDWVIGDESGVVVIPPERAVEIVNRALDIREKEGRLRAEIKKGSTLSKVTELKKWELRK